MSFQRLDGESVSVLFNSAINQHVQFLRTESVDRRTFHGGMSFLHLVVLVFIPFIINTVSSQSSNQPSCRHCIVGPWSNWGACSERCGPRGVKWRQRRVVRPSNCTGKCSFALRQLIPCNRKCNNGGTIHGGVCRCKSGYSGVCCEGGEWLA